MSHATRRLVAASALVAGIALVAVPASADQVNPTADTTATTQSVGHQQGRHLPRVVQQWADAWNTGYPAVDQVR